MSLKKILVSCFVLGMFLAFGADQAEAENYPNHPVKLLTMTGPGAQIDLVARSFAEQLKKYLGATRIGDQYAGRFTWKRYGF